MDKRWPVEPLLPHLSGRDRQEVKNKLALWARGGLSDVVADHMAVRLGFHPVAIWPDWFEAAPEFEGCDGCGGPVGPRGGCLRCEQRRYHQHRRPRRVAA